MQREKSIHESKFSKYTNNLITLEKSNNQKQLTG